MDYLKPSFSVGMSRGVKDDDDFARRWEETFGPPKDRQDTSAKPCTHAVDTAWKRPCPACQNEFLDELTRAAQECGEYGP